MVRALLNLIPYKEKYMIGIKFVGNSYHLITRCFIDSGHPAIVKLNSSRDIYLLTYQIFFLLT